MTIPTCSVLWGEKNIYAYNTYINKPHRNIEDMKEKSSGTQAIGDRLSSNAS
jgi:hypothetical protein